MPTFYEFFAGGGMARIGLGPEWTCLFANDVDAMKCAAYRDNFGGEELLKADIRSLTAADLPGRADLAWASFPCQDLSLAGDRQGLAAGRSGLFYEFMYLIRKLISENRSPDLVVVENVTGLITSHGGADFRSVVECFVASGYVVSGAVIDAARFLPQSRRRLFLVASRADAETRESSPAEQFAPASLQRAVAALPAPLRDAWRWPALPQPPRRNADLIDIVERRAPAAAWLDERATARLLSQMAPAHRKAVEARRSASARAVGTVFRRIRREDGRSVQRAEVRYDGLAGCLRTPAGGSSRQFLLVTENSKTRARLLSPRECARLMGLDDDYRLPMSATAAYKLTGDGVVAPVVRWTAEHWLAPLLSTGAVRHAA